MGLNDLLNIELCMDTHKMFNQVCQETSLPLDKEMGGDMLAHKLKRQLKESSLMKNAIILILSSKKNEELPNIQSDGERHPRKSTTEDIDL